MGLAAIPTVSTSLSQHAAQAPQTLGNAGQYGMHAHSNDHDPLRGNAQPLQSGVNAANRQAPADPPTTLWQDQPPYVGMECGQQPHRAHQSNAQHPDSRRATDRFFSHGMQASTDAFWGSSSAAAPPAREGVDRSAQGLLSSDTTGRADLSGGNHPVQQRDPRLSTSSWAGT